MTAHREPDSLAAGQAAHGSARRWALIFAVWTIPALLGVTQTYLQKSSAGDDIAWGLLLLRTLPTWYVWALLTPMISSLARRWPLSRGQRWSNVGRHLLAATAIALPYLGLWLATDLWLNDGTTMERWQLVEPGEAGFFALVARLIVSGLPTCWIVYSAIVATALGNDLRRRYRQREIESSRLEMQTARLEKRLAEARLAALRAQLQPHFLFNTLHAISALMDDDVAAARQMVVRLGELLRHTLEAESHQLVPLEEEIEVLERYLEIERVRFGERLDITYEVDQEALTAQVPTLVLQPLVENAVHHGVAKVSTAGKIHIAAHRRDDQLDITVTDDGPGLGNGKPREGIGLANTRARLAELFGAAGALQLLGGRQQGLTVRLSLPFTLPSPPQKACKASVS